MPNAERFMFDSPATPPKSSNKKRANLMSLSREFTDSEKSVRSQYTVSSMEVDGEKHACEEVWTQNGFFGELKADFTLHKKDFPENCLIYLNQAYVSSKDSEAAIYCDYVVLGQLLTLKNPPENNELENSSYLKLYSPSYDRDQGRFLGIKECVAYIMIRGYEDECFYTYGFDPKKSSLLYCYSKQLMPNVFKGTAFNCHDLLNVAESKTTLSNIFFYLPSITDRKEGINQYKDQVALVPITFNLEDFSKFSPREDYQFNPADLDAEIGNERASLASKTVENWFHHAAKMSNNNMLQNVFALLKKEGLNQDELEWAPSLAQSMAEKGKFELVFEFF